MKVWRSPLPAQQKITETNDISMGAKVATTLVYSPFFAFDGTLL